MTDAPEPPCPRGHKPHRDRIRQIVRSTPLNKVAGVCIDNLPEHVAYYLQELARHREISIVFQGVLSKDVYLIKITKSAVN